MKLIFNYIKCVLFGRDSKVRFPLAKVRWWSFLAFLWVVLMYLFDETFSILQASLTTIFLLIFCHSLGFYAWKIFDYNKEKDDEIVKKGIETYKKNREQK